MAENETAKLQESIDELKNRIAKLERENAELKGKSTTFEPAREETYYRISGGEVRAAINCVQAETDSDMSMGNCFRTRDEAEQFIEWLKARKILLDDAKGFEPDWFNNEQCKWYLLYDANDHKFEIYYCRNRTDGYTVYFEEEDDVKASLKEHEAEWRIFMGLPKKDPE